MIENILMLLFVVTPIGLKPRQAMPMSGFSGSEACDYAARQGPGFEIWALRFSGQLDGDHAEKLKFKYEKVDCESMREAAR